MEKLVYTEYLLYIQLIQGGSLICGGVIREQTWHSRE
jgi:hypothetical protein